MKRYLGAYMNVYITVCSIALVLGTLGTGIFWLVAYGDITGSVFLFVGSGVFLLPMIVYSEQMLAWVSLDESKLKITALFRKSHSIEYSKCVDVGIAYYFHGAINSSVIGSKVYYIYLSYTYLKPKYKNNINLAQPTKTFVKIGYSKKTYEYLMKVLPKRQAIMLCDSYKRTFK